MKGSIPADLLVIVVFITVFSIVVIAAYHIADSMQTTMDSSGVDLNTSALNDTKSALKVFNSMIPFIFFSFIIIASLLAYYLRANPAVAIFMFIIFSVFGYIAQAMVNVFYDFSRNSIMASSANEFPYVVYLMDNLGYIILISSFIFIYFMFTKPKSFNV